MDEERGFPPYVFHEIVATQRFLPDDNSGWWGVPYPVISGFMSGIGCIILILQVGPLVELGQTGRDSRQTCGHSRVFNKSPSPSDNSGSRDHCRHVSDTSEN